MPSTGPNTVKVRYFAWLREKVGRAEEDVALPPSVDLPVKTYPAKAMFMGGVAAALREKDGTLVGAADPRRTGAVALG